MQEDMVKGCKAKCVERANEYKYKNLGPFFSQGENGPENGGAKRNDHANRKTFEPSRGWRLLGSFPSDAFLSHVLFPGVLLEDHLSQTALRAGLED